MARVLYLLLVLLVALPVFAQDGVSPAAIIMGYQGGLTLKFGIRTILNSKPPKKTFGVTLVYSGYDAEPASADEIPGLLLDLQSGDEEICGKALARLSISGDQAAKPLAQLLTGEDRGRRRAATILVCIGTSDARKALQALPVEPLLIDLANDDGATKMTAALILASTGDKTVADKLTAKMQSDIESGIPIPIMIGLMQNSSIQALPLVEGYLTDEKPEMRALAVLVVSATAGKQAFDKVIAMLGDSHEMVHMFTVMALSIIDDKRVIPIVTHILLFDEHPEARMFTLVKLGETKEARLIPVLTRALQQEKEAGIRVFIVFALGQMPKTPECLAALMVAGKDDDENVRKAAETMLKEKKETK